MTMTEKNKGEILGDIKKDLTKSTNFKYVVSEGSIVVFNLHDFISNRDEDINIGKIGFQSCIQTNSVPTVDPSIENDRISFTAPYVNGNEPNTRLSFKLTIKDKSGKTSSYLANVIVKRVQRAMIFQGGVALGAYEAGVFRAIVEKLVKNDEDKKRRGIEIEKRPLFDIVAGASIGAMNGAVVISNVTKKGKHLEDKKNWQDSAKEVMEFWRTQKYMWPTLADMFDMNPLYHYWRDGLHNISKVFKHSVTDLTDLYLSDLTELYSNMNSSIKNWFDTLADWSIFHPTLLKDYLMDSWYIPATAEAARRYYSAKQFLFLGAPNVATGIPPTLFTYAKFFDLFDKSNLIPRPDNKHFSWFSLRRTLKGFVDFPIKTEEGEPRLLLVTVDVRTGDAVTFDSYSRQTKYHDEKNTICNENGIEIEHALATGTFPDFFDYPKFTIENAERGTESEEHIFWDGGFRSNTPLREVIQAHRDYWLKTRNKLKGVQTPNKDKEDHEDDVPDLEIYIADLWPSELRENPISFDRDFVENRKWDLLLADKTQYDEQIANVVTDYVDLARRLKNLAVLKGASEDEINHILYSDATSINTIGKTRIYKELLDGRFRLTKVVRIDRKDNGNEIHDKVFDYSQKTIEDLMNVGYHDASVQMDMQCIREGILELSKINGRSGKEQDNHQMEEQEKQMEVLNECLHKMEEKIKIENGDGYHTLREVENLISEVESIRVTGKNPLLVESKESLVAAAKQFQDTINLITTKNQRRQTRTITTM
jgi:NTE family protein